MSIGGAGNRQPTNIVSYPSTSPNANLKVGDPELNAHGRFVAEQQAQAKTVALADGLQRTAQAQPPGKSFTETMGAAFTAMGAAVTNFFKELGDRMASIEMPQLPRISLRRQEAVQAEAAAPQRPADPFEAAMGGKPVSAKVRADFTAFAEFASTPGTSHFDTVRHLLSLPEGNAVAKAYDDLATQRHDRPNHDFMKALRSEEGLSLSHLVSNFVTADRQGAQQLNLSGILNQAIPDMAKTLSDHGVNDLSFRQVPAANGSGFEIEVFSSADDGVGGPDTAALKSQMRDLVKKATASVTIEMANQLRTGGGLTQGGNTFREQKLFNAGKAAVNENKASVEGRAANAQAEIGQLNAMSTPEFAQALNDDPILARHLPQMSADSPARQEYENFVASQPPMSRQAAAEGFYEMVKQSAINESLIEAGLIDDEPADDVEAEPDFSNITGIGTTGSAPAGAASGLPQVALSSLSHLVPLSAEAVQQGKTMEGLQAHMRNVEYNIENLDFLATGTALLRFENALGNEVPPNFAVGKPGAASLSLNVDLPVVKQWAAKFVGDGAPDQTNLPSREAEALQRALGDMPDDAASATDAQRSALTTAMATCLGTITSSINSDIRPRYEVA